MRIQADSAYTEDFEAAKAKALKIGALACYVEDLRREFIEELCFPAVQCNAIYENVYLLGKLQYISRSLLAALTDSNRNIPCPPRHCPLPNQSRTKGRMCCCLSRLHWQRETIKFVLSLHSTPSSPPSRSLPHGACPNSTSDSQAATISSTTPPKAGIPSQQHKEQAMEHGRELGTLQLRGWYLGRPRCHRSS
jgi:hypothetical protein